MIFLLKLSICWGFFALFYALMLRQETFFHLNRLYLLSTAVLGILLAGASDWLFSFTGSMGTQLIALPVVDIGLQQLGRTAQQWGGLNLLWALAAGLKDLDWRDLTDEQKDRLRSEAEME